MKNLLIFLFLHLITINLIAQPSIEWQKMLGGVANEGDAGDDNLSSSQQTSDGGFVLAGYTYSTDGDVSNNKGIADAWVVKLNSTGNLDWQRTYGGSFYDAARSIRQTKDGGYILGCSSVSLDGDVSDGEQNGDFWIVKLDLLGEIQWKKSLGGSGWEDLSSISQTSDGGYIVIGSTMSKDGDVSGFDGHINIWVVKLNDIGEIEWQIVLGGSAQDTGMDIIQTNDGGYILASFVSSNNFFVNGNHGAFDCWIVKLSASGDIEWRKAYGGSNNEFATCLEQTRDGGYIMAGTAFSTDGDVGSNNGNGDYWVVKLSALGMIEWRKVYGGSAFEIAYSVRQTSDDGYIVGGWSRSNDGDVLDNHGNADYWLVKTNNLGELQWQKTLGGSKDDYANDLEQTDDGGYIISGISNSNDGDVSGNHGANTFDYWIVKLSAVVGVEDAPTIAQKGYLEIFPNPSYDKVFLKLSSEESILSVTICNTLGRKLSEQILQNGESLDVSTLSNGVYYAVATSASGKVYTNKLTISK